MYNYNNEDSEYLEKKETVLYLMEKYDIELDDDEVHSIIKTYDILSYTVEVMSEFKDKDSPLRSFEEFADVTVKFLKYEKLYPGLNLIGVESTSIRKN